MPTCTTLAFEGIKAHALEGGSWHHGWIALRDSACALILSQTSMGSVAAIIPHRHHRLYLVSSMACLK